MNSDTFRAILSGIGRLIPVAVAVALALWNENIGIVFAVGVGVGSIIVVAGVEYVLTYSPAVSYRDRQLSTFFSRYLELVEDDIECVADGDVEVRANIMRRSSEGFRDDQTYKIAFYADEQEYDNEEFQLEFDTGQGCVGQVHESGDQEFAISPPHEHAWEDGWGTSDRQDRVTDDLNTIIGTPVFDPDTEREIPAAVLMIDSEYPMEEFVPLGDDETLADIEFKDTAVAERATDHASDVGILL